jgi:multimeric flavodoxin WrbA
MKLLFLIGSYRKNGNTDLLTRRVAEHLREIAERSGVGLELETVYLAQYQIGTCRGCRACFDLGEEKCPLKDDVPLIKARMQQADGVLIASPVYVDDVSGLTKTFIDRLAHVCHRPEFGGKVGYLLATSGSVPTGHALRTLGAAFSTWGFYVSGRANFVMGGRMAAEQVRSRFEAKAEKIAGRLFNAVQQRKFEKPTFLSLLTFKIQQSCWQRTPGDTRDYRYWQENGWIDPRCNYYFPQRAGWLKVAAAGALGALVARFLP